METLSFALGMASVGVLLIVVALIWVMFKVQKINTEQQKLENRLNNSENHYSDEIKEVYNTIHSRVDEVYRNLDRRIDDSHNFLSNLHDESTRYTDSRIDKLINNPKFCLNKDKELLTD